MTTFRVNADGMYPYGSIRPIPLGQVEFSKVQFSFSGEWDGLDRIAQFVQGDAIYNQAIGADGICTVPSELQLGPVTVYVKGYRAGEAMIATANGVCMSVVQGAPSGGTPPVPPGPDLYAKLLQAVQDLCRQVAADQGDLSQLQTQDKDNLVAAINELVTAGGGSVDPTAIEKIVDDYLIANPPGVTSVNDKTGAVTLTANDIKFKSVTSEHPISMQVWGALSEKALLDFDQRKANKADIPKVPAWSMQPQKPKYTAQEVGALSQADLQSGIDTALEQAKVRGEFDGKPGENGGHYTPVITQPDPEHITVSYTASKPGMTPVSDVMISLPKISGGSGGTISADFEITETVAEFKCPFELSKCISEIILIEDAATCKVYATRRKIKTARNMAVCYQSKINQIQWFSSDKLISSFTVKDNNVSAAYYANSAYSVPSQTSDGFTFGSDNTLLPGMKIHIEGVLR